MPLKTRKGQLRSFIKTRRFMLKSKDPIMLLSVRVIGRDKIKKRLQSNIRTLKKLETQKRKRRRKK